MGDGIFFSVNYARLYMGPGISARTEAPARQANSLLFINFDTDKAPADAAISQATPPKPVSLPGPPKKQVLLREPHEHLSRELNNAAAVKGAPKYR